MKKQLVILLEYEEDEDCGRPASNHLYSSDIHSALQDSMLCSGSVMSQLSVTTADDNDMPLNFDKVVNMIKESVDDD